MEDRWPQHRGDEAKATSARNPIQATTELPQVQVLKHHYNTDIANPQNEPEFQLAVSACGRDEQLLFYGAAAECLIQRSETRFM
ncbi:hypothetical protein M8J75_013449 [Diaphorina citri]|nr:hypothetical protein M8J75_013449 [Diaphorina citri]